jgi:Molybdopterin converting factor, small subunit
MKIRLLLFGKIKEIIPTDIFELNQGGNLMELKKQLENQYIALQSIPYTIAVNHAIVDEETIINENDLVAIMPPFSGG